MTVTRHYLRNEVVDRQGYADFRALDPGTDATSETSYSGGAGTGQIQVEMYLRTAAGATTQLGVTTYLTLGASAAKQARTVTVDIPRTAVLSTDAIQVNISAGGGIYFCTPDFGADKTLFNQSVTFTLTCSSNASSVPTLFYGNAVSYADIDLTAAADITETIRKYLQNAAAGYTPSTIRGAWDATASSVVKGLAAKSGASATIAIAETTATVDWDVLLGRFVSDSLYTGTYRFNTAVVQLLESNVAADFYPHVYAYLTQGDSDTPRGVLHPDAISSGEIAAGSATGIALANVGGGYAVAAQTGDRLVVEIGYRSKNTSTTSRSGTLRYGGTGADTSVGDTATTTVGWVDVDFVVGVPDPPTSVAVDSAALLTWTKSPYATGYKVYRDSTAGATTLIATLGDVASYQDAPPLAGTSYYRVKASNTNGDSAYSSEVSWTDPWAGVTPTVDSTRFTAINTGAGVDLLWATDPAVAAITNHAIRRGTTTLLTIATVTMPDVFYHDADGVAGSVYTLRAAEGGRVLKATAKATSTLTVDSASTTAVALSWTAVTGAVSYKLWRGPYNSTAPRWVEAYSGTGLSYTDTAPIDGYSDYLVQTLFGTGEQTSYSARQTVQLVLTKYISPVERAWELMYDRTEGRFGCSYDPDELGTRGEARIEYYRAWLEDHSEVAWTFRELPLSYSRYAADSKDYIAEHINSVPLLRFATDIPLEKVWSWDGSAELDRYVWSATTGAGFLDTGANTYTFALASSPATITVKPPVYAPTNVLGVLVFGYLVGETVYVLNNPTRTMEYNPVTNQAVLTLTKTENSVTVTFTLVFEGGRVTTTGSIQNNTGGSVSLSVFVQDIHHTADASVTHSISADTLLRAYSTLGIPTAPVGTFSRHDRQSSWSASGDVNAATMMFAFGTIANGATGSGTLLRSWFGEAQYSLATYGSYYTAPSLIGSHIGSPCQQGRVPMGIAAYLQRHSTDTTFKADADAFLATLYANRAAISGGSGADGNKFDNGVFLWSLDLLAETYPSDSNYSTWRDQIATELAALTSATASDPYSMVAYGLRSVGNHTDADRFGPDTALTASSPSVYLGMSACGEQDPLGTDALKFYSWAIRCVDVYAPTQYAFTTYLGKSKYGTGEAMAWGTAALARIANACGGAAPVYLGRTKNSEGQRTDGLITAMSWNSGTNVLSCTVDTDVWFYTGNRGKPTAVKRNSGATTLTEILTDPGTTSMTVDQWYFDSTINVVKVGVTSTQTVTLDMPAVTFALDVSNIDTQGCNLDHTIYSGADFTSYKLWRSTTSNIDGTGSDVLMTTEYDAGVNTYHDTGASSGTTYYYRVELVTTGGSTWSDEETVTTVFVLVIVDAAHAHAVNTVTLTLDIAGIDEASHAHTVDAVALLQHNVLTVADAQHAHAAESPTLVTVPVLIIVDAGHAHTVDSLVIVQKHVLTVADGAHSHAVEGVTLVQHNIQLVVADAAHAMTVDTVTLTYTPLVIADASHAMTVDQVTLSQAHTLTAADALHSHTADNVTLIYVGHVALVVADTIHAHTADGGLSLRQYHRLVIADTLHTHVSDVVSFTWSPDVTFTVAARDRDFAVAARAREFTAPARTRTFAVNRDHV